MVLILTDAFDAHADIVIKKLSEQNINYYRFNLDVENLKKSYVSYNGDYWNISTPTGLINSRNITCVWCRRPFVELTLQEQQVESTDFRIWKNEWNNTLAGLYYALKWTPANEDATKIYATGANTSSHQSTYAAEKDDRSDSDRPNEGMKIA